MRVATTRTDIYRTLDGVRVQIVELATGCRGWGSDPHNEAVAFERAQAMLREQVAAHGVSVESDRTLARRIVEGEGELAGLQELVLQLFETAPGLAPLFPQLAQVAAQRRAWLEGAVTRLLEEPLPIYDPVRAELRPRGASALPDQWAGLRQFVHGGDRRSDEIVRGRVPHCARQSVSDPCRIERILCGRPPEPMVAVFCQHGQQLPYYQGHFAEVRQRIDRDRGAVQWEFPGGE